jgi:GNAT superfamily N-acetyltransferase
MTRIEIVPYAAEYRDAVVDIALKAWAPAFKRMREEVPPFAFDAFYPDGWAVRQAADVGALLDAEAHGFWLALRVRTVLGFVGIRLHPEDCTGEIAIVAVSPDLQRQGVGRQLIAYAEEHIRAAGMAMVMVETVGDSGHTPARRTYEAMGYEPWPVARYFKPM